MKAIDRHAPEYVIGIRGNHCTSAHFPEPVIDLHMKTITLGGMTFGGFCGSWKYKAQGNHMFHQHEVNAMMQDFPAVDVFIAHNSPRTIHERDHNIHQGFDAFLDYIDRTQPAYFLHGHQHCNRVTTVGETRIIGVYGEKPVVLRQNP
jgi:Icc-related predicted phosphoesterase